MDDTRLNATRRTLHGVAELILAGPQYRRAGTIRLLVCPGGFRTVAEPRLRVDGTDLVIGGGADAERRLPMAGHTYASLATEAGVDVGAPAGVYKDGSDVRPDDRLDLDPDAARWLEDCWAAGDTALRRLSAEQPILWPEHFDVGILADGVGYGVSPGDGYVTEPYAYVSPPHPRDGTFWNAPFGAARPMRELGHADPDAVLAFFAEGRDAAAVSSA
jgi:hypothetical protein